jgi:23S rRNA (cytosine1962-C5)-methyltransferase
MYEDLAKLAEAFFSAPQPETRRIFHGRGQLYPGLEHLSVDWFAPVVLITTYEEIEDPQQLVKTILPADKHNQISSIQLQYRKRKGTPAVCLHGKDIKHCVVEENGLRYEIQPGLNQNAGLFLDMQPTRQWLKSWSADKNVLNLFAYTCSLSVAALAGHARQVVNVDMSKPSINWGSRNHELNGQEQRKVRTIPHNLFRSWGRIKQYGRYDTVIIDPPTRQRGSFDAEKNYGAVLKKLKQLTNPGADIIATVNSPYIGDDFLIHQFERWAPETRFLEMMPRSPEFADKYPERALKIYHFKAS